MNDGMLAHRQKAGFQENCTEKKDTQRPPRGRMGLLPRRRGEKRKTMERDGDTEGEGGRRPAFRPHLLGTGESVIVTGDISH